MTALPIDGPTVSRRHRQAVPAPGHTKHGEHDFPFTGDFLSSRLRNQLDREELSYVENLVAAERIFGNGETLVERGRPLDSASILASGIVFRTVTTGDRRFIVGLNVPGDLIDLHGFALGRLDHSIIAVGHVRIGIIPHKRIEDVTRERPSLTRALWFATQLDAAIHRKWIQMLEQLDAPQRIAHLYCELQARLALLGRAATRALRTPFTQQDLADMCGVSAVHANRAVGKLRDLDLAEIRRGTLYTNDWDALRDYARFDPAYLYGEGPLRLNESWA